MKKFLSSVVILGLYGCASSSPRLDAERKVVTFVKTGCPQNEISILERGSRTWTAVCKNQIYSCSVATNPPACNTVSISE